MKRFSKQLLLAALAVTTAFGTDYLNAMKRKADGELENQPPEKRLAVEIPSLQKITAQQIAENMKATGKAPTFMRSSTRVSLALQEEIIPYLLDTTNPDKLIGSIGSCKKIPTPIVIRILKNHSAITPSKLRYIFDDCCIRFNTKRKNQFIRNELSQEQILKNEMLERIMDMILVMTEDKFTLITQSGHWGTGGLGAALPQAFRVGNHYLIDKFITILGDRASDAIIIKDDRGSLLTKVPELIYSIDRKLWLLIIKTAGDQLWKLLCMKDYDEKTALMNAIKEAASNQKKLIEDQQTHQELYRLNPALVSSTKRNYDDLLTFIYDLLEAAGDNALNFMQIRDNDGKTALDIAVAEECIEVINLLKEKIRLLCPQQELSCTICCNDNPDITFLQLPCCSQTICLACGNQSILQGYQHVMAEFGNYGPESHRCPFCRKDISAAEYQIMVDQAQEQNKK